MLSIWALGDMSPNGTVRLAALSAYCQHEVRRINDAASNRHRPCPMEDNPMSQLTACIKSVVLVCAVVVGTAACATRGKYESVLNSWVGADINRLMASWGPPSDEYTMPNSDKMFTWLWIGGTRVVANYNQYLNMITAGSVTYWCKTTFTASRSGRINSWRWEGNACRSR